MNDELRMSEKLGHTASRKKKHTTILYFDGGLINSLNWRNENMILLLSFNLDIIAFTVYIYMCSCENLNQK